MTFAGFVDVCFCSFMLSILKNVIINKYGNIIFKIKMKHTHGSVNSETSS